MFKVREKSGNFEIGQGNLNTKKVREKSGNFIIWAQNTCCSRCFDYLKCEKSVDFLKVLIFFSRSLCSLEAMKTCYFRTFCAKKLFKDCICFICRIREVHFSEPVKGVCHLSAANR